MIWIGWAYWTKESSHNKMLKLILKNTLNTLQNKYTLEEINTRLFYINKTDFINNNFKLSANKITKIANQ